MTESNLRGKQRRYLRGLGVNLEPTVFVGKEGLSPALLTALDHELNDRELVKVRLLDSAGDRKAMARELADRAEVELVQVLGRTALLYRRNEEEPQIELPE